MITSKTIGRLQLDVRLEHQGSSVLSVRDGYNDSCRWVENRLSVEELRDLRYMVDRAIAHIESAEERRK